MEAIVESEQSEREKIIADLLKNSRIAQRLPVHYVDQKKAIHAEINDLLTLLELLP